MCMHVSSVCMCAMYTYTHTHYTHTQEAWLLVAWFQVLYGYGLQGCRNAHNIPVLCFCR